MLPIDPPQLLVPFVAVLCSWIWASGLTFVILRVPETFRFYTQSYSCVGWRARARLQYEVA